MQFDMGYGMHYSQDSVKLYAKKVAAFIHDLHVRRPCIVVRGVSGISAGFATLMLVDFHLFVARKKGENTHGSPIEGPNGVDLKDYYILDDFINTGSTVIGIIEDLNLAFEQKLDSGEGGVLDDAPRCLGVIQYKRELSYDNAIPVQDVRGKTYYVKGYAVPA